MTLIKGYKNLIKAVVFYSFLIFEWSHNDVITWHARSNFFTNPRDLLSWSQTRCKIRLRMCCQCLSRFIETNEGPLTYWYRLKTPRRATAGKAQIKKNDGWIPFSCSAHLFGSWPDTLMHEVQTHSGHIYHKAVPLIHTLKRRLSNGTQPIQGSNEGNGDAATTAGHSYESCEVWHRAKRDWVSRCKISWTLDILWVNSRAGEHHSLLRLILLLTLCGHQHTVMHAALQEFQDVKRQNEGVYNTENRDSAWDWDARKIDFKKEIK